jgi:hypothetical protein
VGDFKIWFLTIFGKTLISFFSGSISPDSKPRYSPAEQARRDRSVEYPKKSKMSQKNAEKQLSESEIGQTTA